MTDLHTGSVKRKTRKNQDGIQNTYIRYWISEWKYKYQKNKPK